MALVPKKNISQKITDIRGPRDGAEVRERENFEQPVHINRAGEIFSKSETKEFLHGVPKDPVSRRHVRARRVFWTIFAIVVMSGLVFYNSYRNRNQLVDSASVSFEQFQDAARDLVAFRTKEAQEKFSAAHKRLERLLGGESSFVSPGYWSGNIIPFFEGTSRLIWGFKDLTGEALALAREIIFLKSNWFELVFKQRGGELIRELEKLKASLDAVDVRTAELAASALKVQDAVPLDFSGYLPLQLDASRFRNFLATLLLWLKSPEEHRVLVFLQNPSEMRPGGGFIGSYIDIAIENGNLKNLAVHDINDPDRELGIKIVPPKPLQAIVTRWRAADANWFFDFSDSASKVIEFMEASNLYNGSSTAFDGAIGLSSEAVADLFEITGPIELPGRKLTFNKENFLTEIQKQIEVNREKNVSQPKKILSELVPLMLEKLSALQGADKERVFALFENWLRKRDMMFYFKDPEFAKFFDYYGWTGKVAALPPNFRGDYFAVVNSNIGGGKTDIVVREKTFFQSHIDAEGIVSNHVSIERTHEGVKSSYGWYRVPNQTYTKIYTPPVVKLENFTGGFEKNIAAPVNYKEYATDDLILSLEATAKEYLGQPAVRSFEEYGRNAFAFWSKVDAGKTAIVTLDYTRRLPSPPALGQKYQFIFERQSGSRGSYKFEINSPIGFRWRENGLPVFEYETNDPDGRISFELTLQGI